MTERISFRQVNRETGNRLRQQLVDSVTGEVVESHNKGRGYEIGENTVLVEKFREKQAEMPARSVAPPGARSALNGKLDQTLNAVGMKSSIEAPVQHARYRPFENFGSVASLDRITFDHDSALTP